MKYHNLRGRILAGIKDLITKSCPKQKDTTNFKTLHIALLKKHYNAADVSIDYQRKRVEMQIVMDDKDYDPKTVNLYLPTLHFNLSFMNLSDLLMSCIDSDNNSLAFYATLLDKYHKKSPPLMTA